MRISQTCPLAALVLLLIPATTSHAAASCLDDLFIDHKGNLDLVKADPGYPKCQSQLLAARTGHTAAAHQAAPSKMAAASQAAAPAAAPLFSYRSPDGRFGITPILRQDFGDVALFSAPTPASEASGATISYTSDAIARNRVWAMHGTAALVFDFAGDYPKPNSIGVLGFTAAPYVSVDRAKNSNPKSASANADTTVTGGTAEIGIGGLGGQNYFRVRGASVRDGIADTTTGSEVFEWHPVYGNPANGFATGQPAGFPLLPNLIYRFDPVLIARHDALPVPGSTTVKEDYWRTGAGATLTYRIRTDPSNSSFLAGFLQRVLGETTVSWLRADDSRQYRWLTTSLTLNLDEAGHLGLTASYKKGRDEDTGAKTDVFMIGLAGKL